MTIGAWRRLYRLRPLPAFLFSLPIVIICGWYAWQGSSHFYRYREIVGSTQPLTPWLFQLSVHDVIRRDIRWLTRTSDKGRVDPQPDAVVGVDLEIDRQNTIELINSAGKEDNPWVKGKMVVGKEVFDVEMRLRGERHWHYMGRKKSMKIRILGGKAYRGWHIINLMNYPWRYFVSEKLALDLARRSGLVAPDYDFAWVRFNGQDLGIFHLMTHPNSDLFYINRSVGGNLYSGNSAPDAMALWERVDAWKKVGERVMAPDKSTRDLERLLRKITSATYGEFAAFAREEMDMEAFATFEALDVISGNEEHNFYGNYKLFFDSYKGKWAPIAWDYRVFNHVEAFNAVENPISLRLKTLPDYTAIRNRTIYSLLTEDASLSAIIQKGEQMLTRLWPVVTQDRLFEGYEQLPLQGDFFREMIRPMTMETVYLAFRDEMVTYRQRRDYLLSALKKNPLYLTQRETEEVSVNSDSAWRYRTPMDIIVAGPAAVEANRLTVSWPDDCVPNWQVSYLDQLVGDINTGRHATLDDLPILYPSSRITARQGGDDALSPQLTVSIPERYRVLIQSNCPPHETRVTGIQQVTGMRITSRASTDDVRGRIPENVSDIGQVPNMGVGEVAPPAAQMAPPLPVTFALGPGTVIIDRKMVFGSWQSVVVRPGTEFVLNDNGALIFQGPVQFNGTAMDPIVVRGSGTGVTGGVGVIGTATAGSRFTHVQFVRGGGFRHGGMEFPAVMNIHHTRDVQLAHCRFVDSRGAGDALHVVYGNDISLDELTIVNAAQDGVDLEFSDVHIRGLRVHGCGDDALDLMGSTVRVQGSVLAGCKDKALSVGENSDVVMWDFLLANSAAGVLLKDKSSMELSQGLFWGNDVAIETKRPHVRYPGKLTVGYDNVFAADGRTFQMDKGQKVTQRGFVKQFMPAEDDLVSLRDGVLGIDDFLQLRSYLDSKAHGGETP